MEGQWPKVMSMQGAPAGIISPSDLKLVTFTVMFLGRDASSARSKGNFWSACCLLSDGDNIKEELLGVICRSGLEQQGSCVTRDLRNIIGFLQRVQRKSKSVLASWQDQSKWVHALSCRPTQPAR